MSGVTPRWGGGLKICEIGEMGEISDMGKVAGRNQRENRVAKHYSPAYLTLPYLNTSKF